MKKKPRSLIRKFVLYLFAVLFFITTIIFLVFGVKGYFMYQEAVKAYPISQMVSSIQNRENFVEYDELPTTQEKKLERKFAEIFTAIELEQYCSKQEIFELYVNTIYFGNGYYGIYDAAKGYYGKLPSELSDYEAIMLAGLPNAPSAYSLNTNPDLAYSRMKIVLSRMVECGVITQEQANDILANGN